MCALCFHVVFPALDKSIAQFKEFSYTRLFPSDFWATLHIIPGIAWQRMFHGRSAGGCKSQVATLIRAYVVFHLLKEPRRNC
jgi:hypothetical protein